MMAGIIAWFVGTKFGRWLVATVLALGAIALVVLEAFQRGKDAQRRRETENQLNAVKDRNRINEDVARLPSNAVDDELRKWSR